jgi:archaellum biogenesis ATPase FlaH
MKGETTTQPAGTHSKNENAALKLAKNGYKVFPCDPATKAPMGKLKWKDVATDDLDQINEWWHRWPDAMPGLPTGSTNGVSVVDLDMHDSQDGITAYRNLGLDTDASVMIIRSAGGGLHLYFDHQEGIRNSTTKAGIDVRGEGGYVIGPGAVSNTGTYTIEKGDPAVAKLLASPFPKALIKSTREHAEAQPVSGQHRIVELADALFRIPNDGPHDDWVKMLMAIHDATAGSAGGLALVQAWSTDYPGYDAQVVVAKWRSLGKRDGARITADTLFAEAKKFGWQAVTADDFDDDLPSVECFLGDDTGKSFDLGGLTFLLPDDCANLPARDYVVKRLIAPGQVGCIFGVPGAGKSLIAPRMAYDIAQGEDTFGLRTKAGPVIYVACEDQDGMAGRVAALHIELGDADTFHLFNTVSDLFTSGVIEGKAKGSPDLEALCKAARAIRPQLIVIDTLAMAMPGLEENDAAGMNRVVQIGKRLAKYGAAVIFVHHGTKASGETPRGHSVFNGALDFSIMVKAADKNGIVRGMIRKNRNGPPDLDIAFKISSHRVGKDIDGEPVDAPICMPCDPGQADDNGPKLTETEQAGLNQFYEMEENGPVTDAAWRKRAIDNFNISASDDRDNRRRTVTRALKGLLKKGQIVIEDGLMRFPYAVGIHEWDDELEGADQ